MSRNKYTNWTVSIDILEGVGRMKNNLYPVGDKQLYGALIINGFEEIKPNNMYRNGSTILFNYGEYSYPVNIHVFQLTEKLKEFLNEIEHVKKEEEAEQREISIKQKRIEDLKNNSIKDKDNDSKINNKNILYENMIEDLCYHPGSFMNRYWRRKFHL